VVVALLCARDDLVARARVDPSFDPLFGVAAVRTGGMAKCACVFGFAFWCDVA
jgi:hypothetical protein